MSASKRARIEALIAAEVDRAVAPYEGKVPPFMLAKLRELAERYYREHPVAGRILEHMARGKPAISGDTATEEDDADDDATGRARKG